MIIASKKQFKDIIIPLLHGCGQFAIDYETTGSVHPCFQEITVVGLCFAESKYYAIPTGARAIYQDEKEDIPLDYVLGVLKAPLENPKIRKIAHNAKFEKHLSKNYGIHVRGMDCTLIMASLVDENKPLGLKVRCADVDIFLEDTDSVMRRCISNESADELLTYCEKDALTCYLLFQLYRPILRKKQVEEVYTRELAAQHTAMLMERRGIRVSAKKLARIDRIITKKMQKLEVKIYKEAGRVFNLGSPKQLGEVLFGEMGLRVVRETAGGSPSTDAAVLEELSSESPIVADILEYRKGAKLSSGYTAPAALRSKLVQGRIHTNFNTCAARTSRISSSDPNLQVIPSKTDTYKIRSAFIAKPGYSLIVADESMMELRMMAHWSRDPIMTAAFQEEKDLHMVTTLALGLCKEDDPEDKKKEARYQGKTMNFALLYGMGYQKLARELKCSEQRAERLWNRYWSVYKHVVQWKAHAVDLAKSRNATVRILGGYVRTVPQLYSSEFREQGYAERQIISTIIQGSCAVIVKHVMIRCERDKRLRRLNCQLLLQVHDELVFECPDENLEPAKERIKQVMEDLDIFSLRVPFVVSPASGKSWYSAKG